jgi:hypothetical protein
LVEVFESTTKEMKFIESIYIYIYLYELTWESEEFKKLVITMYHGGGGCTKEGNEGEDRNLANKRGHGFKH